jgi:hypothetical protein
MFDSIPSERGPHASLRLRNPQETSRYTAPGPRQSQAGREARLRRASLGRVRVVRAGGSRMPEPTLLHEPPLAPPLHKCDACCADTTSHMHMNMHAHMRKHEPLHACVCLHTQTCTHMCAHACVHVHEHTCTNVGMHALACMQASKQARKQASKQARNKASNRACTHAHHAHTHTMR